MAIMAATAAIQGGISAYSANKQIQASNEAQKSGAKAEIAGQNQRTLEGYKKRQEGTVLGGSPSAQQVSEQGTVLTGTNKNRSLLG